MRELGHASGLFNFIRTIGGSIGIAAVATFLQRGTQTHQAQLASHVSLYDPGAWDRYQMLVATFMARGADPATAEQQAWGHLYQTVQRQALLLSFIDNFWWLVWIFAAVIPLVFFLGGRPRAGESPADVQRHAAIVERPGRSLEHEAGRRHEIRPLGEQPRPRRAGHALGLGDDGRLVQREHVAVAHEPAPVHHHGLDVAGLALVHEARDGAQRGCQMRAAKIHHDEVGAVARREPAAVGDAERTIAVARGPRQRLLGGWPAAVGAAHALHEHRGAHDLDHVLGHVVGAERDQAARALQRVDARGETTTRGDGGGDGDGGAGGPERDLFFAAHAAAGRGDDARWDAGPSSGVPAL